MTNTIGKQVSFKAKGGSLWIKAKVVGQKGSEYKLESLGSTFWTDKENVKL